VTTDSDFGVLRSTSANDPALRHWSGQAAFTTVGHPIDCQLVAPPGGPTTAHREFLKALALRYPAVLETVLPLLASQLKADLGWLTADDLAPLFRLTAVWIPGSPLSWELPGAPPPRRPRELPLADRTGSLSGATDHPMPENLRPSVHEPVPDWETMARGALALASGQIDLPGPCAYRLVVLCGPRSTVDHIKRVFTTAFGYEHWQVRLVDRKDGKYELQGLRTVQLCTLEELLQHYREVADVMTREDCGTHRITIGPVK